MVSRMQLSVYWWLDVDSWFAVACLQSSGITDVYHKQLVSYVVAASAPQMLAPCMVSCMQEKQALKLVPCGRHWQAWNLVGVACEVRWQGKHLLNSLE